eukprot:1182436-Prorocentrum_minimum.AAC.6
MVVLVQDKAFKGLAQQFEEFRSSHKDCKLALRPEKELQPLQPPSGDGDGEVARLKVIGSCQHQLSWCLH